MEEHDTLCGQHQHCGARNDYGLTQFPLKGKEPFSSFEMFLFPVPFPHFHSEVTAILNCVSMFRWLFFAVWAHLCVSTQHIAWFTCFWTFGEEEGILLFVWRLTSFALTLFCCIHIIAYTCGSSISTHSAHCVHILLVFMWLTLNCWLPFSMVLFLLFPYSELNISSFFSSSSTHNLAIVDKTLWGPRFTWGVGKNFPILPPSEGVGIGACDPGSCRVCKPKLKLNQLDKTASQLLHFSGFLISLAFLAS